MAAHLFGYVGEVSETAAARRVHGIEPGTIVGQAGVEQAYNKHPDGADGSKPSSSTASAARSATLDEDQPNEASALQLTIDADMQKATEDAFDASGFNGAAVVLDPRNGEVLGVHQPSRLRSERFAAGIDRATWASLNTDDCKPLQNRALQGRYSPGSTFKMAVGLAGARRRHHHAELHGALRRRRDVLRPLFECWKKGGHGTVDLRHAIEQSCDVYFYTVGNMLGVDTNQQVGDAARPRRQDRTSICRTRCRGWCRRPSGSARRRREVVRGRDDLGRRSARARSR